MTNYGNYYKTVKFTHKVTKITHSLIKTITFVIIKNLERVKKKLLNRTNAKIRQPVNEDRM